MIIVSQDKKRISENLEIGVYPEYNVEFPETKILCYKIENDYMILGEYKTEERAKEVLQEIKRAYSDFRYYEIAKSKEKENIGKRIYEQYGTIEVYEMPEE